MARGYIYNKGRSNCNPLQQSCDWAWGLLVCLFLTFTVVPQPLIKCEQKGLLKNPCITCRLKRANLKCINPASRGLPGSRYKPERHPEPLLLGRPGPALEGGLPFRRAAQPRPALRCGAVRSEGAGRPRPTRDTLLLLMQLKIPLVCLAAAPAVDSY